MNSVNNDLPLGWRWVTPPEISSATPNSLSIGPFGSNLRVSDYKESGVPLIFVRNIRSGHFAEPTQPHISLEKAATLRAHIARAGDVLITKMGDPPGDAALYPSGAPNAVITADCIKWSLNPDVADGRFIVYATKTRKVREQILTATRGVAQRKISLDRFRSVRYPLPPLAEQIAIVSELEKQFTRLDAAKSGLRSVERRIVVLRQSVLHSAFTLNASGIRGACKSVQLGTVLRRIEAGKNIKCEERPPNPTETGIVKVSAVTWGEFNDEESKTCGDRSLADERLLINPGDFLFSRANTLPLVGACVIVNAVARRVMLSDKILRFVLDGVAPRWVLHFLRSPQGRRQIESLASGNQLSMRNISQDKIRRIMIPLPDSVTQDRIVADLDKRLSHSEALEDQVASMQTRLRGLRDSILAAAFRGSLTAANEAA